jgi:quercetin dioxygenase-like cupin family protein
MKRIMSTRLTAIAFAFVVGAIMVGAAGAKLMVSAPRDYADITVTDSAFDTGFDSRWHAHPGPAIVQVLEGRFKIYTGRSCANPKVVGPGETFVEVPGLEVRAVAQGRIAWTTTIVMPRPAPSPRIPLADDSVPECS